MRALMLRSAQTAIIVADHQKFGRVAPVRVPGLEKTTCLVTNVEPGPRMADVLRRIPVQVIVAQPADPPGPRPLQPGQGGGTQCFGKVRKIA